MDIFVDHLPSGVAHFGKRLLSYSEDMNGPQTTLSFDDGTSVTCDILVGADGIKSTIRSQMFREVAQANKDPSFLRFISPVWTGTMAYRGLIHVQDIPLAKDGSLHRTIKEPMMVCFSPPKFKRNLTDKGSTAVKARCPSTLHYYYYKHCLTFFLIFFF